MGLAGAGPGGAPVGGSAEIREARLGLYGLRGWAKRLVAGRSLGCGRRQTWAAGVGEDGGGNLGGFLSVRVWGERDGRESTYRKRGSVLGAGGWPEAVCGGLRRAAAVAMGGARERLSGRPGKEEENTGEVE